jgi:ABC-type transport system involved in cytochrome c biogenesis permease subunit
MELKRIVYCLLFLIAFPIAAQAKIDSLAELPVAYKGRIRPMEAYARLWLEELYQQQQLPKESALNLLWSLHFFGHTPWNETPLFFIRNRELKQLLKLNPSQSHFSYTQLTDLLFAGLVLDNHLAPSKKDKKLSEESLTLFNSLSQFSQLEGREPLSEISYETSFLEMTQQNRSPKEIALSLEAQFPLKQRLVQAGTLFKMLPSRYHQGEWYSLKALGLRTYNHFDGKLIPIPNFTLYSDNQFETIRSAYLNLEKAIVGKLDAFTIDNSPLELKNALEQSYLSIAGMPYQEAFGKSLTYPSKLRLKAETIYYTVPFLNAVITLYALGLFCFILAKGFQHRFFRLGGILLLILAFGLHTFILILRCYILQRPPVSNMFETVIYVPWIAMLAGFGLFTIFKNALTLVSSACVSLILLIVLKLTGISHSLENVQAVLDSQYWLIIHVLMVVGSYGLFCLAGLLGHFYLIGYIVKGRETDYLKITARVLQQSLYLGLALLIAGTLLGGVWAAQSWGRFWDWDPKESWAFISSCVYLIVVHAYTFHHIGHFGLAIGSIIGLQMISFTWYGVNYILGTGLHSYGFGSGGEIYYYLFLLCEAGFILWALLIYQRRLRTVQSR